LRLSLPASLLVSFTALAGMLLFLPSAASAADKDCANFASQRAAQIFFLKHGGPRYDPHRLDGDNDNVACEANPCPCYRKKFLPYRLALALTAAQGERLARWNFSMPAVARAG
jgi:Excalibur calcium-binding domain